MTRKLIIFALTLSFTPLGYAQPADPPAEQLRERVRSTDRGQRGDRLMNRLAQTLDLTAEQRAQATQIFREIREELRTQQQTENAPGERRGRRGVRGQRGERGEMIQRLAERLNPILNETQQAELARISERLSSRGGRQRGDARRGGDPLQRIQRALGGLDLSETQQAQVRERLADLEAALNETRPAQQQREEMRAAFRAAREAGDEDALAELRDQLRTQREGSRAALQNFMESLTEVLTETQLAQLRDTQGRGERNGPQMGRAANVMNYFRAVRRLDLSSEQQELIRDLERELRADFRDARRDNADLGNLTEEYKTLIKQVLDDAQWTQLEQLVQDGARGERQRERRPRGNRERGA